MLCLFLGIGIVNALVLGGSGCSFHSKAVGPHTGSLGEVDGGQVRFGNITPTTFHIENGKLSDKSGKGCWWTPPTHVLQCDANQAPSPGFEIDCQGRMSFDGHTTFYQCTSGDYQQWNIYLDANQGEDCGEVALVADGCHAECLPPLPPAPEACPADLNGGYEFPHLIVPIDQSNPDKSGGTSYFGQVTSSISTIFNFDIPASDDAKICSLVFLFPRQSQLSTSSFYMAGDGKIDFALLQGPASNGTTWNSRPHKKTDYGVTIVSPGHGYVIATFPCPYGSTVAFLIGSSNNTSLKFFQDYNPAPIGLYIRTC